MNFAIIYEDDWLLVVDKPPGLPTQNTLDPKRENLYGLLLASRRWPYLALHHRLDAPTSGLILLCKKKSANKAVGQLFQDKTIGKTYWAIICGEPPQESFRQEVYLRAVKQASGKQKVKVVNSGGDHSVTEFRVLARASGHALLECRPQTGRMHQIRVHLESLGWPIAGDALYGRVDRRFSRLQLHAQCLEFTHPHTKKDLRLTAAAPEDMTKTLQRLGLDKMRQP